MAEEQAMELEALQSIYADDFTVENGRYLLRLRASETMTEDDFDAADVYLTLKFQIPADYPAIAPTIKLDDVSDLITPTLRAELIAKLDLEAAQNLGLPSVFAISSAAKDFLDDLVSRLQKTKDEEDAERVKRQVAEEVDKSGTPCTVESFMIWKEKFDKERAILDQLKIEAARLKATKKTGRQMFESDAQLATSDNNLLEDGDVVVDESLFEHGEDDEDDDDDEDFVPHGAEEEDDDDEDNE